MVVEIEIWNSIIDMPMSNELSIIKDTNTPLL